MKKILLWQHGGSGNHGCEALVRTTYSLVREAFPNSLLTLYSFCTGEDKKYLSDLPLRIEGLSALPSRLSAFNLAYHAKKKLGLPASKFPVSAELRELAADSDLVLAIGGDNYCYDRGAGYYVSDSIIRGVCKKYVLFGCSVEPRDIRAGLGGHLQKTFDLICVRESLSYDALRGFGIGNALFFRDPAFLLPAENAPAKQNAVGINLSPLALGCGSADMIMQNYTALIRFILENTDMSVVLVPHVVWPSNDDRLPLSQLQKAFPENARVTLAKDASAPRLKGLISSLRFFVGARTHSTIAAYSTSVPTIAAGYSVKAEGIARDLLGDEPYVVRIGDMSAPDTLTAEFRKLMQNEDAVKAALLAKIPQYRENARGAAAALQKLL